MKKIAMNFVIEASTLMSRVQPAYMSVENATLANMHTILAHHPAFYAQQDSTLTLFLLLASGVTPESSRLHKVVRVLKAALSVFQASIRLMVIRTAAPAGQERTRRQQALNFPGPALTALQENTRLMVLRSAAIAPQASSRV